MPNRAPPLTAAQDYKPLSSRMIADLIGMNTEGPRGLRRGEIGHGKASYEQFADLLLKLLTFDPETRLKPTEAIMHDFFRAPAHLRPAADAPQPDAPRVDVDSPDMFKETASKKHAGAAPPNSATAPKKPVADKPAQAQAPLARQASKRLSDGPAGRRSV